MNNRNRLYSAALQWDSMHDYLKVDGFRQSGRHRANRTFVHGAFLKNQKSFTFMEF